MGVNVHEPLARLHVDGPIIVGDNQGAYNPHAGMIRFNYTTGHFEGNTGAPNYTWAVLDNGSGSGSGGSGAGWQTNGNTGTNPATDYLGTSDNQPLVIKVNGQRAGDHRFRAPASVTIPAGACSR